MSRQYLLLSDSKIEPSAKEGMKVYAAVMHDYGLASDDTRITGVHHISVTFKEDGDYPFFTHPLHLLQEIK
jgi:hypothetical protein